METTLQSLKALSDETRIRLLLLLLEREACVCELMEVFTMAQSKLSHHLLILRDAGLLHSEKRGKWNYYRTRPSALQGLQKDLVSSLSRSLAGSAVIERDKKTLEAVRKRLCICC